MTFTKEDQIQAIYDLKVGYTLGHADIAILKSMAFQLLAALESRADADQHIRREVNVGGNTWVQCSNSAFEKAKSEGKHVRELYERPQPAPVVPDEIDSTSGSDYDDYYCDGWNACRAAMLQGAEPVKTGLTLREGLAAIRNSGIAIDAEKIQAERDALSEPVQGWIPCSEQLPPEGYESDGAAVCYLVWHKNEVDCGPQYGISNVFFLRKHWEKNYSHWMPLPAGPEEVKGE